MDKIFNNSIISGTGHGSSALTIMSNISSSKLLTINLSSDQDEFKIKNARGLTISELNLRTYGNDSNILTYNTSYDVLSVDNTGLVTINASLKLKDSNYLTQSFIGNNKLTGSISGFVLHNGYKVNSPWFNTSTFTENGSFFWMEPGWSKTWDTYSLLGDINKVTFDSINFNNGDIINYKLYYSNNNIGITYSDISNVTMYSNTGTEDEQTIQSFSKYTFSDRIELTVYSSEITNLSVVILGKNIYSAVVPFTYSTIVEKFTAISRAGGSILTNLEINALNGLMTDLTSIYSSFRAIYPMVGGTSYSCSINLVNPSEKLMYSTASNSGLTFSNNGILFGGSASAITATRTSTLAYDNKHFSFSAKQLGTPPVLQTTVLMGSNGALLDKLGFDKFGLNTITGSMSRASTTKNIATYSVPKEGLFTLSVTMSSIHIARNNDVNTLLFVGSNASDSSFIELGKNSDGYAKNIICTFASIGNGLSSTNIPILSFAVSTFNTFLSR